MTSRKKNRLLIQITIFLVATTLFFNTYTEKNKKEMESFVEIKTETNAKTNTFTDIEYSGFDLTGNRYVLKAQQANFKTETPELIDMSGVIAKFYLKDNTVLTVVSDSGLYNNITLDIDFKEKVKADYLTHVLFSDSLSYSNSNAKLIASGNVKGKSLERGEFSSDYAEYNLTDKTINFSMFGKEQVNIKIKN